MTTASRTTAIVDGAARVFAEAIAGKVFAAGVTDSVIEATPEVVPVADDWTQVGFPVVTCVLGEWTSRLQPGNERLHLAIQGAVWRERAALGEVTAALYADRDAISDAVIAHGKAFLTDESIQSAVLQGGPGIVPRVVPMGKATRVLLSLPFTVNVICNRAVVPQVA